MKTLILIVAITIATLTGLTVYGLTHQEKPKYVYAVRENIDYNSSGITFELWCWKEFSGARVEKSTMSMCSAQRPECMIELFLRSRLRIKNANHNDHKAICIADFNLIFF